MSLKTFFQKSMSVIEIYQQLRNWDFVRSGGLKEHHR